jgi:hypothetical protein
MYPVSIPMDGSAINFTLVSNNENLDFGIVACRKSVPQVQRLIDYMEESLVELEDAAGLRRRRTPAKRAAKRGAAATPKASGSGKSGSGGAGRAVPKLKTKAKGKSKARPKQASAGK